jgi:DNA-directed RNA polymerase
MQDKTPTLRSVASAIGRVIHHELVLDQIADFNPDLYHVLTVDFNRRLSKDERHRMTVYKMQAAKAGINLIEWPLGARDQVGIYLLGLMEAAGMVEIERPRLARGSQAPRLVSLSDVLQERIMQIKGFVSVTMPVYGPCVAEPLPWTTLYDGGFHTPKLRRAHPCLVHHREVKRLPHVAEAVAPTLLAAANALQNTRWQVNEEVLDAVLEVGKWFTVGDIASPKANPRPEAPPWLKDTDPANKEAWSQYRQDEFRNWKRVMTDWYTARKLAGSAFSRYYAATRSAEMFRGYPTLHFVYFADSRGRLYPMTYGLNPQGGDLQRGLLRFAEGKPLTDEKAVMWFCIHGANKYGFDKATFEERQQWVMDREDLILSFAENPVDNRGWKDAGNPIQFLAWCFEFKRWREQPHSFVSHIPVSMDGSCNGLQNLSALLRDEIGGEATNLTANSQMQDIYRRVAEAATKRLQTTSEDEAISHSLRLRWLQHGISRAVVKRSVMTTPYGVTKRSAADYVVSDYLRDPAVVHPFEKSEYMKAASYLMEHVWPAIGDVVVKGREAMDWLRRGARLIIADEKAKGSEYPVISWISPSGFPAFQSYYEYEEHRINTRLQGPMKIVTVTETDEPDQNKHSSGLAPNFVHSMDAAHLHLTAAAAAAVSIDALAMIHDDYGCHACDAEKFFHIIREQFVSMYESHDPINEFHARYRMMPAPPSRGTLDIREVLESRYFFS